MMPYLSRIRPFLTTIPLLTYFSFCIKLPFRVVIKFTTKKLGLKVAFNFILQRLIKSQDFSQGVQK